MINGVEILKMQFSRAIDQTLEHFLEAWSLPSSRQEAQVFADNAHLLVDIPVMRSSD